VRARFLAAYEAEEALDRDAGWVTSETREAMRWRRIVADSLAGVRDPEACFHELFNHFGRPDAWRPNLQAAEVLDQLRTRGMRVGIGSNYDARLVSVLGGIPELAPLRDRVVISAAVGYRKPALGFFREVTRVADCEPGEILFVGNDFENDHEGARRAGLRPVLLGQRADCADRAGRVSELEEILA
jgi:putative hydrolase of the HAD superfamily